MTLFEDCFWSKIKMVSSPIGIHFVYFSPDTENFCFGLVKKVFELVGIGFDSVERK